MRMGPDFLPKAIYQLTISSQTKIIDSYPLHKLAIAADAKILKSREFTIS